MINADGREETISMCTSGGRNQCPGWYHLKQYVGSRAQSVAAHIAPRESSFDTSGYWMHQYLRPIQDLLKHRYTAVGVLEKFDTTLALFNATLHMPGLDWPAAFRVSGKQNDDELFALEEATAVLQSKADPDIQATLWLDILLYDFAVGIFHEQAKEHDLL